MSAAEPVTRKVTIGPASPPTPFVLAADPEGSGTAVEQLANAMWDALSDGGVLRIDADSPKELMDIASAIFARLAKPRP